MRNETTDYLTNVVNREWNQFKAFNPHGTVDQFMDGFNESFDIQYLRPSDAFGDDVETSYAVFHFPMGEYIASASYWSHTDSWGVKF